MLKARYDHLAIKSPSSLHISRYSFLNRNTLTKSWFFSSFLMMLLPFLGPIFRSLDNAKDVDRRYEQQLSYGLKLNIN